MFDLTPKALKQPGVREAFEKEQKEYLNSLVPAIVERMSELPSYMTHEISFYTKLMEEARKCYEFGLFHAAVSMVGIAAERFAMELSVNLVFKINDTKVTEQDLYNKKIDQHKRLNLLLVGGLITKDAYLLLDKVRDIRNKYVHPKEVGDAKKDALEIIDKFNTVIYSRFSDKYTFKEGQLVLK